MAFRASIDGEAPIVTADAWYEVWRWLWWSDFEEAEGRTLRKPKYLSFTLQRRPDSERMSYDSPSSCFDLELQLCNVCR